MRRTYPPTLGHGLKRVLAVAAVVGALGPVAAAAATAPTLATGVALGATGGVAVTRSDAGRVLSALRAPGQGTRGTEQECPGGAGC